MATLAYIGLGSNLGDRRAILDAAAQSLAQLPGTRLASLSRYHETTPVGGPSGQGRFLNAAAAVETTLDPIPLLAGLQAIEANAGRIRVERWGERTLDLDLLLFGSMILDTPTLSIPHPWMAVRRFVLAPLAEIAPDGVDPVTETSIRDLLNHLDRRPSVLCLRGCWRDRLPSWTAAFESVVRTLHAHALRLEDVSASRSASRGPEIDWRKLARLMDSRKPHGDRWIVADFAPDEFADDSETDVTGWPSWRRTAGDRASVRPTIVVRRPPTSASSPGQPGIGNGGVPTLLLASERAEALAETMIDACKATRMDAPNIDPPGVYPVLRYRGEDEVEIG
ncbi:2-amino-4-hydroxy-6-hydroxymethyldihydropteridine diphosphokinase [Aquisphaera insulae]|uniref:2-amino-4-hydroxy-6- hydroxymethyldihydropteridine diphosphokinase n=1 Tax=Aquisphaera insulae TaxID=2712864 RepID=UPI0013EC4740|nr:2-amino-4-hydroxy-6-hydroxymethyldihydropteridine diphosphokinase [Aquisphaera insulae]